MYRAVSLYRRIEYNVQKGLRVCWPYRAIKNTIILLITFFVIVIIIPFRIFTRQTNLATIKIQSKITLGFFQDFTNFPLFSEPKKVLMIIGIIKKNQLRRVYRSPPPTAGEDRCEA